MSRRLLISRSRPDVSTVAGAAGTGVGAGASVAATLGTLCWLLIRARVGPGEMVHASSSLSIPCSGKGTCSMATLAKIFRRSSLIAWSAFLLPPEFPLNGHAIVNPPYQEITEVISWRDQTTMAPAVSSSMLNVSKVEPPLATWRYKLASPSSTSTASAEQSSPPLASRVSW